MASAAAHDAALSVEGLEHRRLDLKGRSEASEVVVLSLASGSRAVSTAV